MVNYHVPFLKPLGISVSVNSNAGHLSYQLDHILVLLDRDIAYPPCPISGALEISILFSHRRHKSLVNRDNKSTRRVGKAEFGLHVQVKLYKIQQFH